MQTPVHVAASSLWRDFRKTPEANHEHEHGNCMSNRPLRHNVVSPGYLKRSSKAFRAEVGAGERVSRSTRAVGLNSSHELRASFGETRALIDCRHSKRAPGSNDSHWTHDRRSTPQRLHWLSKATSAPTVFPHRVQRITWVNPGILVTRKSRGSLGPRSSFGFSGFGPRGSRGSSLYPRLRI